MNPEFRIKFSSEGRDSDWMEGYYKLPLKETLMGISYCIVNTINSHCISHKLGNTIRQTQHIQRREFPTLEILLSLIELVNT